jgi:hypothetical protein
VTSVVVFLVVSGMLRNGSPARHRDPVDAHATDAIRGSDDLSHAHDPRDAFGPDRLRRLATTPDRQFAEWLRAVCPKDVDVTGLVE